MSQKHAFPVLRVRPPSCQAWSRGSATAPWALSSVPLAGPGGDAGIVSTLASNWHSLAPGTGLLWAQGADWTPRWVAAVQEERQRGKDRNENEVESTSSANEDMPVEKILEAELAVEPKTETYVEANMGLNPNSVSAACALAWPRRSPHGGKIPRGSGARWPLAGTPAGRPSLLGQDGEAAAGPHWVARFWGSCVCPRDLVQAGPKVALILPWLTCLCPLARAPPPRLMPAPIPGYQGLCTCCSLLPPQASTLAEVSLPQGAPFPLRPPHALKGGPGPFTQVHRL